MPTLDQILEKIKPHRRDAFMPNTVETTGEHNAEDKFGGLPYLRNAEDWPRCSNCNKHMQLFVQLDLSRLPQQKGKGLAQFFYCTTMSPQCEVDCEAWFPNTTSTKARLIEVNGPSATVTPEIDEVFAEQRIAGWERRDDYPNSEELGELGIELDDDEQDLYLESDYPLAGDKLFGWPHWIQGVEYHLDDSSLFVQIDSECHVPFMFGDCGCAHLTRSNDDPAEMAFGWACG